MITTDLNLAAYLKTKGHEFTIKRIGARKVQFDFIGNVGKDVENFFNNEGDILGFTQTFRAMKSQVLFITR